MIDPSKTIAESPKLTARKVRQHYQAIEAALVAGLTHEQVHAWLGERGVTVEFGYYKNILYRIRKAVRKNGGKVGVVASARTVPYVASTTSAIVPAYGKPQPISAPNEPPLDVSQPVRDW